MSTPNQWELGGEILDKGKEHRAFLTISESWSEVEKALAESQQFSKNLKKVGVGRTEDPTLILARIVPALEEHAETVRLVARQMRERLG